MTSLPSPLAMALADRYRLERELGQGGMATVYLAQDVRHDRKVAIKVLRPELAAVIGAERFLREIKTIANLQHPHILGLIDSGEVNGTAYYVMPYVEGESLRDRLNREKQLPISDAVRFATEVASALDYAHRHGVIHRDIKPENVMLHDGSALVTDFGIALAVSSASGSRMTETGMSLGTPNYMSPEQAMGEREITARSDVYALGAMTYEMLIGEPPFSGPTAQAIVAKVLTEEPRPLVPRRHSIPPEVEAAVLTALEKLPADRFGSAAEFATALSGRAAGRQGGRIKHRTATPVSSGRLVAFAAGILAIVLGAYWIGGRTHGQSSLPLSFGQFTKVTWDPGVEVMPAISPDGKTVAFASGTQMRMRIFVRPVSGGRGIPLTDDTTEVQSQPRWSPDGSRVLFLERGGVFSAPASGGAETPEVPPGRSSPIMAAAWSPDGKSIGYAMGDSILLRDAQNNSKGIARVFEAGGCTWSPDARYLACSSGNAISLMPGIVFGNVSPSKLVLVRVDDGSVQTISDSLSLNLSPVWSADGAWLYFVSNRYGPRDIFAQKVSAGKPGGPPVRLTTGLNAHSISLSADGRRLAYADIALESNARAVTLPAHPPVVVTSNTQLTTGAQTVEAESMSPDGKWLFYDSDLTGNMDLYRMALPRGTPERLTNDPADDFWPDVSPNGKEVAWHSWRGGSRDIYVMPLDGGPTQRVTTSPRQEALASWSPDGNRIAFSDFGGRGGVGIVNRTNGAWGRPQWLLDWGYFPRWSPDGKTLNFSSRIAFGSLWVMAADSGAVPRPLVDSVGPQGLLGDPSQWSPDGRSVYVRSIDSTGSTTLWAVPALGGPPRLLLTLDSRYLSPSRGGWGVRANQFVYSAPEQRSDIWVMEVRQP
ncbi:MAG TPA: protein kinase [Gemmatimonadales bacterium]|nr:protein kinase [Gemmatimonadales bacterium]